MTKVERSLDSGGGAAFAQDEDLRETSRERGSFDCGGKTASAQDDNEKKEQIPRYAREDKLEFYFAKARPLRQPVGFVAAADPQYVAKRPNLKIRQFLTLATCDTLPFVDRPKQRNEEQPETNTGISLSDLAQRSGVPERTIRYYIARGILPGPARGGRGAEYTEEHLARIRDVRRMQGKGLTLAEIEYQAKQPAGTATLVEPESWSLYQISPDVTVQVRSGLSPWRVKRVRSAIAKLAAELNDQHENGEDA